MVSGINHFVVGIFLYVFHFFGYFFNAMTVTGTATIKDKPGILLCFFITDLLTRIGIIIMKFLGEEIFLEEVVENGEQNGNVRSDTKEDIHRYVPRYVELCSFVWISMNDNLHGAHFAFLYAIFNYSNNLLLS